MLIGESMLVLGWSMLAVLVMNLIRLVIWEIWR